MFIWLSAQYQLVSCDQAVCKYRIFTSRWAAERKLSHCSGICCCLWCREVLRHAAVCSWGSQFFLRSLLWMCLCFSPPAVIFRWTVQRPQCVFHGKRWLCSHQSGRMRFAYWKVLIGCVYRAVSVRSRSRATVPRANSFPTEGNCFGWCLWWIAGCIWLTDVILSLLDIRQRMQNRFDCSFDMKEADLDLYPTDGVHLVFKSLPSRLCICACVSDRAAARDADRCLGFDQLNGLWTSIVRLWWCSCVLITRSRNKRP